MTKEIVKWDEVFKSFGKHEVLKGLTLSVFEGETLTIIGGSGSGKSVMLKLLLGLIPPDSGRILFDGMDITKMRMRELIGVRRQIGMLFQGGALFDSLTVGENVAYPLKEQLEKEGYSEDRIREIVVKKLALVGLEDVLDKYPSDLSGGMKKRVALARAIAADPRLVLYDEPTTGLDPANTRRINHLIRDIQRECKVTSIVVTHDMESAFFVSDRIAMLYNKKIEFVGTPDEVMKSDNKIVKNFVNGYIGDD
jgi:phospholipid/cholesterol/gamma-HCH transport system ATP-binding protein